MCASCHLSKAGERLGEIAVISFERQRPRTVSAVNHICVRPPVAREVAPAHLRRQRVRVRVEIGLYVPERRPPLHGNEPRLDRWPFGVATYAQALVVEDGCGHPLEKWREPVHSRNFVTGRSLRNPRKFMSVRSVALEATAAYMQSTSVTSAPRKYGPDGSFSSSEFTSDMTDSKLVRCAPSDCDGESRVTESY